MLSDSGCIVQPCEETKNKLLSLSTKAPTSTGATLPNSTTPHCISLRKGGTNQSFDCFSSDEPTPQFFRCVLSVLSVLSA